MNTFIHDITYACSNAAASIARGSICLVSPDLGRFWGGAAPPGRLFPVGFIFIPLLDIIYLLDIGSLNLVGPINLSCVRFYHPAMVIAIDTVVFVAVFVKIFAIFVLG